MPNVQYPDVGAMWLAGKLDSDLVPAEARLFSNTHVVSPATKLADLVESAFAGYVRKAIAALLPPYLDPAGGASTQIPTLQWNYEAGAVGAVTITAGGAGYVSAPTVSFSGGGGSGAAGTAVIAGGAVTGINITNTGSGYTTPPTIAFAGGGGGAGATATVVVNNTGELIQGFYIIASDGTLVLAGNPDHPVGMTAPGNGFPFDVKFNFPN